MRFTHTKKKTVRDFPSVFVLRDPREGKQWQRERDQS